MLLIDQLLNESPVSDRGHDSPRSSHRPSRDRKPSLIEKLQRSPSFLTLTKAECVELLHLIENSGGDDPFITPKFSIEDLAELGFDGVPEQLFTTRGETEDGDSPTERRRLIPATAALVAPNLTPGGDSPVPISAIPSGAPTKPPAPPQSQPQQHKDWERRAAEMMNGSNNDEEDPEHPEPRRQASSGIGESIQAGMKALRANRKKPKQISLISLSQAKKDV